MATEAPEVGLGGITAAPSAPATAVAPRSSRGRDRIAKIATPYLLLGLPVTFVLISLGYPMLQQLIMSFQEFGLAQQFGQPAKWVGLANYVEIASDPYFWVVLVRSLVFCFVTAATTMVIGVALALLLQRVWPAARIAVQIALVLAWATPTVSALVIWPLLVDARPGVVNTVLAGIGLAGFENFNLLHASPFTFWLGASTVVMGASVPLVTLASFAALTQLDRSLLDAAELDGAGAWRRLVDIVLPLIRPVITLLAILQIIWDLRVFTQIHILQEAGGDAQKTNLLGTYIYSTGIAGGDYGMASALAMVMLLILLALTWRYVRKLGSEDQLA